MKQPYFAPLRSDIGQYLACLALLVNEAGGEVTIKQFSEKVKGCGDMTAQYDRQTDTLTVRYRVQPDPNKYRFN